MQAEFAAVALMFGLVHAAATKKENPECLSVCLEDQRASQSFRGGPGRGLPASVSRSNTSAGRRLSLAPGHTAGQQVLTFRWRTERCVPPLTRDRTVRTLISFVANWLLWLKADESRTVWLTKLC